LGAARLPTNIAPGQHGLREGARFVTNVRPGGGTLLAPRAAPGEPFLRECTCFALQIRTVSHLRAFGNGMGPES